MHPSTHLFRLIKTLNTAEKRYFKLFSSKYTKDKKNNYIRLFDAIDKQTEYDEAKLYESFKGEKLSQYLAVIKSQLYELLLESLHNYYLTVSIEAELQRDLHYIEILFNKNLFDQALTIINKAKIKAHNNDKFAHQLNLLSWQKKIYIEMDLQYVSREDIEKLVKEEDVVIEKLRNLHSYWQLICKAFSFFWKYGQIRQPDEAQYYDNLMQDPLLLDEGRALSFDAKRYYYNIHMIYAWQKKDYNQMYFYLSKLINHFDSHHNQREMLLQSYISTINNILITLISLSKFEDFDRYIDKIKNLKTPNKLTEAKRFRAWCFNQLLMYNKTGQFEAGLRAYPEIRAAFENYKSLILEKTWVQFYYHFAYLHFGGGLYEEARFWINKIFEKRLESEVQDVYSFSHILNLLIQYELDSTTIDTKPIISSFKYLLRSNRLFQVERLLLDGFRKLRKVSTQSDRIQLFLSLKSQLEQIYANPYEANAQNYFDFISWLESKINDVPFSQTVQKRIQNFTLISERS